MENFFNQIASMFNRYTTAQKSVMITLSIGMVSAIIALVVWASRPEYELLYADIDPTTASKMVSDLKSEKVRYRLENGGKTILIPTESVSEWRLKFTEQGYVGDMVSGYEIFDNSEIGMTTFKQKLNMRRALEGELTRTINQFPGVMNSRVHLALPQEKLFEKETHGKASVVLYLVPGVIIEQEQVKGISALIANSVDGINADAVVVVDSDGKLLSDSKGEQTVMGSTGNQWDLKNSVESRLQTKIQDILDGVLGYQNSIAKVSVNLNFEKIERTTEAFDPDKVVILSEERQTESSFGQDSAQYAKENVLTNYELNKTVEHYVSPTGGISRVTVAVLVDGTYVEEEDEEGEIQKVYQSRSDIELNQISDLVKSAVGYMEERGDLVEVENIQFDRRAFDEDMEYFEKAETRALWASVINKGLLLVSVLVALFVMKTLFKTSEETPDVLSLPGEDAPALEGLPEGDEELEMLEAGESEDELSEDELSEDEESFEDLEEYFKANNIEPTDSLKNWFSKFIKKSTGEEVEDEIDEDIFIKKLSPEARAILKAKDKMTTAIIDFAKEAPVNASKLIHTWMNKS
jgi:flagellar M-ring protein FliF|tara:strand:- start:2353 stop:4086 length:1734 start_codon:yes stop_codon:yes gene_type:complete